MANKCVECGCTCKRCISSDDDVQLHVEIENLKQRLVERETHIVTMETNFLNETIKFPNGELIAVKEELLTWQDKYKRLYEAHRRVQRVNQGLEHKLLKLVDACETEKNTLTKDVATLSHKLAEANYAIKKLTEDNERYKNDVSLAIQFLQCKQSNFVAHKFDSLSSEVQSEVSNFMTYKKKPEERKPLPEAKSIKVPIPTFPPTAMVYSVPKSPKPERIIEADVEAPSVDIVSAAIMAKVLEERQKERALAKHCDTCTCAKNLKIIYENTHHSIGTQTGEYNEMLCLRCNEHVQVASVGMKIVRNSDFKANKISTACQESADLTTSGNNIVKVQPNNFLNDNSSLSNSNHSSLRILNKFISNQNVSLKSNIANSNNHVISKELDVCPDVLSHDNELLNKNKPKVEQLPVVLSVRSNLTPEKADSEDNVDKTSVKNKNPKGSKYCSVLIQNHTRNILLDNAQSNVAPVLYTRSHKIKFQETSQTHDMSSNIESHSSNDEKINSMSSETSAQNQQRVAEWIQNNLDNEVNSSDNSRADSLQNKVRRDLNKEKYAEMEQNVKRFLFGESEFLKKVEIGKQKYQDFQDVGPASSVSKKSSHTETNI